MLEFILVKLNTYLCVSLLFCGVERKECTDKRNQSFQFSTALQIAGHFKLDFKLLVWLGFSLGLCAKIEKTNKEDFEDIN